MYCTSKAVLKDVVGALFPPSPPPAAAAAVTFASSLRMIVSGAISGSASKVADAAIAISAIAIIVVVVRLL